jgi:methionine-rich copper-binding protein CopC
MRKALPTLLLIAAAGPAWAHAILVQSTPAPQSHIKPGTLTAILHYNSRIDAERSKLTLTQGTGPTLKLTIIPGDSADSLWAQLTLNPGPYVLRWQVLATDGHITRGNIPFSVDAP